MIPAAAAAEVAVAAAVLATAAAERLRSGEASEASEALPLQPPTASSQQWGKGREPFAVPRSWQMVARC